MKAGRESKRESKRESERKSKRGLDYRLSFADVPVIRLLSNHNLKN